MWPRLDYCYVKFVYLATVGFTIIPCLDGGFVGLHNILRVPIICYDCGIFVSRADDLLRVRILI